MRAIVVLALGAVLLSGCSSEPSRETVDFAGVDAEQKDAGGDPFTLRVHVAGIDGADAAEASSIEGAFVGAAEGSQALAKSTTDSSGMAVLRLRSDQTVRIVAQADGWTTEDSGRILLGRGGDSADSTFVCVGPFPCVVFDEEDSERETALEGKEGDVTMVLFRKEVKRETDVRASPHANGAVYAAPDGQPWIPEPVELGADKELHRLYMQRLDQVDARLEWTNSLTAQGDLELGLGCSPDQILKRTDDGHASNQLAAQGEVQVELSGWEPPEDCMTVYAGPYVASLSSDVPAKVFGTYMFVGKSRILPINV